MTLRWCPGSYKRPEGFLQVKEQIKTKEKKHKQAIRGAEREKNCNTVFRRGDPEN